MPEVKPDSAETREQLERIGRGEPQALDGLLTRHRADLHAFVEFHLDPRLRARVDPSDVVQDTQLEVVRRMDDFLRRRPMPFHLWMRKTAYARLLNLRRDHVQRARRAVGREVAMPDRSSLLVAGPLLHGGSSPSRRLEARERAERVGQAVAQLAEQAAGGARTGRAGEQGRRWPAGDRPRNPAVAARGGTALRGDRLPARP